MSFFDEADEPPRTETRTQSRSESRRRRAGSGGSGRRGGRRPPSGPTAQSILTRRAIAAALLVVVIVLVAVGVSSCQSSARKSALQNYADNVNSVIKQSDGTSRELFKALGGSSPANASTVSQSIAEARQSAEQVLNRAEGLSVPSAARVANAHLVLALQIRLDGLTAITNEIEPALGSSESQAAVQQITVQMARFYASDVVYKSYTAPGIVAALHHDGIAVGGDDGTPVNAGQYLPSIEWLQPQYVGAALGVAVTSGKSSTGASGAKVTGLHGDEINSVSVAGMTLTSDGNSVTASPAPTFSLSFTDSGNFSEGPVVCKVAVTSTSVTGTKIVPSVAKGATTSCSVTLSRVPPAGNYSVVATIEKVPGEQNLANNTLSFPVTFR